jgi:hypothetical protein
MTIPRPTLLLNFAEAPNILDPRVSFTRATTASYMDRMGVLKTAPAGVPRWRWHPTTGEPQGVMLEGQRTNLLTYSEQLDNAVWTKTSASISANSVAAPDGATTADTITVSGASGNANQAVTITAGNLITVSVHFKQLTSSHGRIRISDGTNQVAAWFNLASGTVGTASAGAGTCIYSAHSMEALPGGWYRCQITVTTATSTAFTTFISCAAADNTESANADSVYAWGAQAESASNSSAASSYAPTTGSTATRNGDALMVPVSSSWFSTTEGTLLFEWVGRVANLTGVYGGVAAAFGNHIYLVRSSANQIVMTCSAGSVNQATLSASHANADGTVYRAAMAWAANNFALCIDGATPSTDTSGTVPTGIARIGIGNAPWDAAGGSQPGLPFRRAAYWPKRLSNAVLQTITQ